MKQGAEPFAQLVEGAFSGELRLPAFQRSWAWNRQHVISLFDSLRKGYPIGSCLFLETRPDFDLSPRPFHGLDEASLTHAAQRYVLDGQQRLTAGIAIYRGSGGSNMRYFLDLDLLWDLHEKAGLDLGNVDAVKQFAEDIDDDDAYCKVNRSATPQDQLLKSKHLMWTPELTDETRFQRAADVYLAEFGERKQFIDYMIRPHFRLTKPVNIPVTTLDEKESLEAITKIFATLNTTGKPLTPFEIVVARLFSDGVRLTQEVDDNREASNYYKHMDPTGEIFLQTIALMAGQTPKKAKLPRTITGDRYALHRDQAVNTLENLGEFLSNRLGVGLDVTGSLVPYDSIFPPMAVILSRIRTTSTGADLSSKERRLEKWFVGAALAQRYQEGVHNKQEADLKEISGCMEGGDADEPTWLKTLQLPRLLEASPVGALGRMLGCLANREQPQDPLTKNRVGFYSTSSPTTERHHIFPKKFCDGFIPGWNENPNVALNVMFTESGTNQKWSKMNPADQIKGIEETFPDPTARQSMMLKHQLNQGCLEILGRPNKSVADFKEFIQTREAYFLEKFREWFPDAVEIELPPETDDL